MPMIRTVLRTRANTATAVQIAQAFKGDHSALCCEYYLLYVSGTVGMRRLLLFSMMTDAGDEVVVVIYASRDGVVWSCDGWCCVVRCVESRKSTGNSQ